MSKTIQIPGRDLYIVHFTNGTKSSVWQVSEEKAREWAAGRWATRTVKSVEKKS